MELGLRKQKILCAVVENYIATGEPTGSKLLQNYMGLGVSSATIRNELSQLVTLGYLVQPHTSAGRIPSTKGYRYYIDHLMKTESPDDRKKEFIDRLVLSGADSPENILSNAALALSQLSDVAAIATAPPGHSARVHKIRFVSTGRNTSMVVLITNSGMVKSRLFRCDFVLTPQLLEMFDKAINEKFVGMPLCDIDRAFLQSAAASFDELSLFMPDVLLAIFDATQQAMNTTVNIRGSTKLLFLGGYDIFSARDVLKFLSDTDSVSQLLSDKLISTRVFLGEESGRYELKGSSVIATRYEIATQAAGALALIGPVRVDYKTLIGELEYTAERVSHEISDLLEA